MNTHLEQLKLTIRAAWLTLAMLPDPDAKFRQRLGSNWVLRIVQDARDAYGSTPASWRGTPTAHEISMMEVVFEWLAWLLGVEDEYSIKRIAAWALGRPIWKMAQIERCSERTIHRRLDRSIRKIGVQFKGKIAEIISQFDVGKAISPLDEPESRPARIRGFTPPHEPNQSEGVTEAGKVYIGGEGFRIRGEKYQSSYDLPEGICGKKRR